MSKALRFILRCIRDSKLPLGWYGVEVMLINAMSFEERGTGFYLPEALRSLVSDGYLDVCEDRYSITEKGKEAADG